MFTRVAFRRGIFLFVASKMPSEGASPKSGSSAESSGGSRQALHMVKNESLPAPHSQTMTSPPSMRRHVSGMLFNISSGFSESGGHHPHPQGIRPPADPKGAPFVLFWVIHIWLTDLKIFLKSLLAPVYTNFEGGARAEKRDFLVDIF